MRPCFVDGLPAVPRNLTKVIDSRCYFSYNSECR